MTMSLDMLEEVAHRFALLADPTRLRILHALTEHGELSVHAVAEAAATSRFNASAHLNRLALGGMVARRRAGSTVFYRVEDAKLPAVCDWICDSLRSRARSLVS
jgi:DNA-binding transcriptional ArsR family regulator